MVQCAPRRAADCTDRHARAGQSAAGRQNCRRAPVRAGASLRARFGPSRRRPAPLGSLRGPTQAEVLPFDMKEPRPARSRQVTTKRLGNLMDEALACPSQRQPARRGSDLYRNVRERECRRLLRLRLPALRRAWLMRSQASREQVVERQASRSRRDDHQEPPARIGALAVADKVVATLRGRRTIGLSDSFRSCCRRGAGQASSSTAWSSRRWAAACSSSRISSGGIASSHSISVGRGP
jgi:hypothetical protein